MRMLRPFSTGWIRAPRRCARFSLGFLVLGAAWTGTPGIGPRPAERAQPALAAVIGQPSTDVIGEGDTLLDVALRHRVGFSALERLNPGVDVWMPAPGTPVALPTAMILPDAPHEGLVINVPEMRLYDFTVGPQPAVLAIAIGDDVDATPQGDFRIGAKRVDPVWHVPESIRREHPELPARVPPGPDNPLGDRWMTLGNTSYGIHGTNLEWSIGRIATHGCIRLYTQDIHALYDRVPEGTPVHLVYQTTKIGVRDGIVYLEIHPDLYGRGTASAQRIRFELLVRGLLGQLDRSSLDADAIERTVREARGVPVPIGSIDPAPLAPTAPDRPAGAAGPS